MLRMACGDREWKFEKYAVKKKFVGGLLVVMVLLVLMVQRVDGRFTNNCAHSVIGDISGDGVLS